MVRTVKQDGSGTDLTLDEALDNASAAEDINIEGSWTVDDTRSAICAVDCQIECLGTSRHPGFVDTSLNHYRLVVSDGNHALTLTGAFTVTIDGIVIEQAVTVQTSDECFRCVPGTADTVTIKNSIFVLTGGALQQDCIYTGFNTAIGTINLENCVIYGASRAGIHCQNNFASAVDSAGEINVNSCPFINNGTATTASAGDVGGGISLSSAADKTIDATNFVVNCHNVIALENDTGDLSPQDFNHNDGGSGFNPFSEWNVSFSIDSDGSIVSDTDGGTGNLASRTAAETDQGVGSFVIFEDITSGTEDLRLTDLGNAKNNAQDMHSTATAHGITIPSTDIVGTSRPQNTDFDCGAFEIVSGAATFTATVAVTTGGISVSSTATFAPGTKTATADVTIGGISCVSSATFTAPVFDATADLTTGPAVAVASATFVAPVFDATANVTIGQSLASASATFTAPVFEATAALTTGAAVAVATAVFAEDLFIGSVAATIGGVIFQATATFIPAPPSAVFLIAAGYGSLNGIR